MRKFNLTIKTDYFCELDLDGFPYTVLKKNEEQVIEVSEGKHTVKLKWTSNRSIFVEREIDVHENTLFAFSFEDYLFVHPEILKTEADFFYCLYSFPRFKAIWDSFDSFDLTGEELDLDDVISVTKDGVKGFADRLGREALDYYYVIREGDKYGFAHGLNRVVIPPIYSLPLRDILNYNSEWYNLPYEQQEEYEEEPIINNSVLLKLGIGVVHLGNKWGFIDLQKENAEPILYDVIDARRHYYDSDSGVKVMKDGKWGIYSLEKRDQIISCIYERIYTKWGSDIYVYESSGKCGFVDQNGNIITEAEYDDCESFIDGIAFVKQGDKWGAINMAGEQLCPFELDSYGVTSYGYSFINKNDKWGVVDKNWTQIIPCEYDRIGTSEGEPFWYEDFVDEDTGDIVQVLRCHLVERFDYFVPEKDGLLGLMTLQGEELLPCLYNAQKYDMRDIPQLLSQDNSKSTPITHEINQKGTERIPLSPDFSIVHTKDGWRICDADGKYVNGDVYDDCVVNYGKVSVKMNEFYREIRRSDAKLVGYYVPYPPRGADDNGVGEPGPQYEFDRELSDDCYWTNGYDMIVDCYGNIIWER